MPTMSQQEYPPPAALPPVLPLPAAKLAAKAAVKRTMYRQDELMHLLEIMQSILPIGPNEWDMVVDAHSAKYEGRDLESLRRKYTSLHRKKMKTGSPNIPPEVLLAKKVKYMIGDKAEIGDGTEEYNMLDDETEDVEEDVDTFIPPPAAVPVLLPSITRPAPVTPKNMGLVPKTPPRLKEKNDFMAVMHLQMQNDSQQRAHEMKMANDNRAHLNSLIGTIAGAYFGSQQKKKPKKNKKRKRRVIEIEDSSMSSMSSYHDMLLSSSDDYLTGDDDDKDVKPRARKRSAD